jgi:hypothetical protein
MAFIHHDDDQSPAGAVRPWVDSRSASGREKSVVHTHDKPRSGDRFHAPIRKWLAKSAVGDDVSDDDVDAVAEALEMLVGHMTAAVMATPGVKEKLKELARVKAGTADQNKHVAQLEARADRINAVLEKAENGRRPRPLKMPRDDKMADYYEGQARTASDRMMRTGYLLKMADERRGQNSPE